MVSQMSFFLCLFLNLYIFSKNKKDIVVTSKKKCLIIKLTLCLAGCTDDIVTSDHSPVFATFEVGVTSQFVSKKGTSAQPITVINNEEKTN